jgi:hypothetical protein
MPWSWRAQLAEAKGSGAQIAEGNGNGDEIL